MNPESYYKYHTTHPWAQKLFSARSRCNNPNGANWRIYGGKGIRCDLTIEQVKNMWFRDKADEMRRPSLDRKNSNKDYTFSNCRFIEYAVNALEGTRKAAITCAKPVDQYTLERKYVKTFKSIGDAARAIGDYEAKYSIASCCRKAIYDNKRKLTARGFIWAFKGESPEWK